MKQKQGHLRVIPMELREANGLVAHWHRHHQPCQGHRFSLGVVDEAGEVHGACIVGRPVARLAGHPRKVLEVTRLVTDGTKNACSMLYAAAAKAGRVMGYERIQTYTLRSESGVSLKAAGWVHLGESQDPGSWSKHTDGKPRRTDQPIGLKNKWGLVLNTPAPDPSFPPDESLDHQGTFEGILV